MLFRSVEAVLTGDYLNEGIRGRKSFATDLFQEWVDSDIRNISDLLQNERISRLYDDFMDWASQEGGNRDMSQSVFIKEAKKWLEKNNLVNRYTKEGKVKAGSKETLIGDKEENVKFKKVLEISYEEKFEM